MADSRFQRQLKEQKEEMAANGTVSFFGKAGVQRKRIVERKERSYRLIVKGAEFEKAFPLSRDLEQEEVQDVMKQLQNSSYNKSIVRQVHIAALHKEQQQIAEAVERAERGDDS